MGDLVDSEDNEGGEGGLCGPRLAPDRDCARSAACHGGLWGVRGRQLRAFGAPQSVVDISRILRFGECPATSHGVLGKGSFMRSAALNGE